MMTVDLGANYPIIWEDCYHNTNYEPHRWVYENIRKNPDKNLDEYLTVVNYYPGRREGRVEFHYQTVGNGFMLWHSFRFQPKNMEDPRVPCRHEMRYEADKVMQLWLCKDEEARILIEQYKNPGGLK
jgi:hypothetical protein